MLSNVNLNSDLSLLRPRGTVVVRGTMVMCGTEAMGIVVVQESVEFMS